MSVPAHANCCTTSPRLFMRSKWCSRAKTPCSAVLSACNSQGAPVQRSRSLSPAGSAETPGRGRRGGGRVGEERIQDLEELLQLKVTSLTGLNLTYIHNSFFLSVADYLTHTGCLPITLTLLLFPPSFSNSTSLDYDHKTLDINHCAKRCSHFKTADVQAHNAFQKTFIHVGTTMQLLQQK